MPPEIITTARSINQPNGRTEPHIVGDTEAQNARRLAALECEVVVQRSEIEKLKEAVRMLTEKKLG